MRGGVYLVFVIIGTQAVGAGSMWVLVNALHAVVPDPSMLQLTIAGVLGILSAIGFMFLALSNVALKVLGWRR